MAKQFLSYPQTSVPIEHLLSSVGNVYDEQLSSEHAEMLLTIKDLI